MLSRRSITTMLAMLPLTAHAASRRPEADSDVRTSGNFGDHRLVPGASLDQGATLQLIIDRAVARSQPVFIPPGSYRVSGIDLPEGIQITGVPGASRLVHAGAGHMLRARNARRIRLSGLVIEGAGRQPDEAFRALVDCSAVRDLVIDECDIIGSPRHGLQLERCGGRIERSHMGGASGYGLYAIDSTGLAIAGNRVSDCGDGGILVHRWSKGNDATLVSGNRISRIAARSGGTGQYGNGINLFRADHVVVSGNNISGCAFSAIRANASSNVLVNGNQCLASGETAIYSEFGFEGAIVSANVVDGAANGISVVNFNEGGRLATITGNIVRNLSLSGPYPPEGPGFGIGIAAEADAVISGNTIENVPKWGMLIGWGPYLRSVLVTGNIVREAGTGIAVTVDDGAGSAMITGNLFDRVQQGGIVGYRHATKATGDITGGDAPFAHLSITGNHRSPAQNPAK